MGRSYTYHVVGETDKHNIIGAMSRLEMAQETAKEARRGNTVVTWHAQTRVGLRMLGTDVLYLPKVARLIPKTKTIICYVCEGDGCPVCRSSGITLQGEERRY